MSGRGSIIVGIKSGDIKGNTNKAIQAGIDYVALQGGGTVKVMAGEYIMYDSIHLRSNVRITGEGCDKTILRKEASIESYLKVDSGYGERQIILHTPEGFKAGQGLAVCCDTTHGFHITVATIVEQIEKDTFIIDQPIRMNCSIKQNARAATVFPVISGYYCENIQIAGIGIDGNKKNNHYLDGCRGGGIYFYECSKAYIENCCITNYNGDGISYQNSNDVIVSDTVSAGNSGYGNHPGGGSKRTIVKNCTLKENGSDGFYFCRRATDALVEHCDISGNEGNGVCIGHRDTDNRIVNNKIYNNKKSGIEIRKDDILHAAHRTLIENNELLENGELQDTYSVKIQGEVHDVRVRNNKMKNMVKNSKKPYVYISKQSTGIEVENNIYLDNLDDDKAVLKEQ